MLITLTGGYGQKGDGPLGGLRAIVDRVQAQWPLVTVIVLPWDGDLYSAVRQHMALRGGDIWVAVGYSYGGGATVKALRELDSNGVRCMCDLALLVDPVPRWRWGQFNNFFFGDNVWDLPDNVIAAKAYVQRVAPPFGLPLRVTSMTRINEDVSMLGRGHVQLPGSEYIGDDLFKNITRVCRIAYPETTETGSDL